MRLICRLFLLSITVLTLISRPLSAAEQPQPEAVFIGEGRVVLMTDADFDYPDAEFFGPPYYSWPHPHDPRENMVITYVIYQNVNLKKLKTLYKIDPKTKKDYRYIRFKDAIDYLDNEINRIYQNLESRDSKLEIDFVKDRTCATSRYVSAYEMLADFNKTALFLTKHLDYSALK